MKLLYLPNERDAQDRSTWQLGGRKAFALLQSQGAISELRIHSFEARARALGSAENAQAEILEQAAAFRPDIIFWQHIGGFEADAAFLARLRQQSGGALLAYQEGDIYGRLQKRMPASTRAMMAAADIVFLVGMGSQADLARSHGARDVRYMPHSYDAERFGKSWTPTEQRDVDVVMIGNLVRSRLPGLFLPGGRKRLKLAKALRREHGARFSLYGRGWDGMQNNGALDFAAQEAALRQGWLSVSWDHFDDVACYFSDRVPIALAAGLPHVTNRQPGYDEIFRDCPGLYFADSVAELTARVQQLLARPRQELIAEGQAAQAWAARHLEADIVFARAFGACAGKRAAA